jgi:hypothetical protein
VLFAGIVWGGYKMNAPNYWIGPALSFLYAVYAEQCGQIQQLTKAMSKTDADKALEKIHANPYKPFKGVSRVYV